MRYEDKDRIIDYIECIPEKTIILEIPKESAVNWELYKAYSNKIDFILCIADLRLAQLCNEHGIKFFWAYPINTFYELQGVIKLQPSYIYLGAPLCFDLPRVKGITDIPIRLIPNVAYDAYIPRDHGVCGQWIRPEDVEAYEPYVDVFEFDTNELQREAVLLHVYKDTKKWMGNLNLLITNLGVDVDNRAISPDLVTARVSCGQRCMSHGTCHLCLKALKYSSEVLKSPD